MIQETKKIRVKAPAKINLYLKVFEKRGDGFHRMETGMLKVDFCDELEIVLSSNPEIEINLSVPGYPDLEGKGNLVYQAALQYLERAQVTSKVDIRLNKRIFMGAGLGGGSSDAGVLLKSLQDELKALSEEEVFDIASQLGSDVPLFLQNRDFAIATGRGEKCKYENITTEPYFAVLLNPGLHVSTGGVYQRLGRTLTWKPENDSYVFNLGSARNVLDFCKLGNDLQPVAQGMHSEVTQAVSEMSQSGALVAQMTGSGSTVFGLFESEQAAHQAAKRLHQWPHVVVCRLGFYGR